MSVFLEPSGKVNSESDFNEKLVKTKPKNHNFHIKNKYLFVLTMFKAKNQEKRVEMKRKRVSYRRMCKIFIRVFFISQ